MDLLHQAVMQQLNCHFCCSHLPSLLGVSVACLQCWPYCPSMDRVKGPLYCPLVATKLCFGLHPEPGPLGAVVVHGCSKLLVVYYYGDTPVLLRSGSFGRASFAQLPPEAFPLWSSQGQACPNLTSWSKPVLPLAMHWLNSLGYFF